METPQTPLRSLDAAKCSPVPNTIESPANAIDTAQPAPIMAFAPPKNRYAGWKLRDLQYAPHVRKWYYATMEFTSSGRITMVRFPTKLTRQIWLDEINPHLPVVRRPLDSGDTIMRQSIWGWRHQQPVSYYLERNIPIPDFAPHPEDDSDEYYERINSPEYKLEKLQRDLAQKHAKIVAQREEEKAGISKEQRNATIMRQRNAQAAATLAAMAADGTMDRLTGAADSPVSPSTLPDPVPSNSRVSTGTPAPVSTSPPPPDSAPRLDWSGLPKSFSHEKLKAFRIAKNISAQAAAKLTNTDYKTYWNIENGKSENPRRATLLRIAAGLEMQPGDLTS